MRQVKWLSIAILLISIVAFADYNWRAIKSRDNLGPVIEMEEDKIYVSVNDKEDMLLKGIRATDSKDGDVTDTLVVESISEFVDGNIRYVNYAAFDTDNHVSKAFRKLVYTDYEPARFFLDGPLLFPVSNSDQDILGIVHAEDCLDGDVSDRIIFSTGSSINLSVASEYPVELQVTNSAGDTQTLPVTVTIYDRAKESSAPQIELTDYIVYTKTGRRLSPRNYLKSVTYQGTEYGLTEERGTFCVDTTDMSSDEKKAFQEEQEENPAVSYDRIKILDETDYQTPGTYEIEYMLDDDDSNRGRVYLVVVVEEG